MDKYYYTRGVINMSEEKLPKSFPLKSIFDKFAEKRDVTLVYGDPIKLEHRTILPVAKVKYSVGAGSGYEDGDENKKGSGGVGGGGQFSIKPVGVYDITDEKTTYKPVVPLELIFIIPVIITGIAMLFGAKSK
ncbi:GerW family sporulation protein [Alkalicoccus daliensis]|uniref:Uncharacterized spore protein YtfJ n=1 Tax=Alkalicoccus daliensis TaxID=745820 RepID=A0A1H0HE53_9BACI|nr:spore germination protein GerW family protein [Alkalicoccus daliensis]SDO17486.1 Uncharacterized spore protein YtfJ [Alkalicoccus daliensis]